MSFRCVPVVYHILDHLGVRSFWSIVPGFVKESSFSVFRLGGYAVFSDLSFSPAQLFFFTHSFVVSSRMFGAFESLFLLKLRSATCLI